jgi:AcrR family transcriptional regulator
VAISDKSQRLLQAAEQLFRNRRVDEVTLDEIAKHADVAKGTIYLYFSDKEDLIFRAAVAGFDEMCEELRRIAVDHEAFRDRLLRTCGSIVAFFQKRRPLFRIILSEGERAMEGGGAGLRQRWREQRQPMMKAVAAVVSQGITSGDLRGDIPAEILAEYLLGMLRTRSWELEGWQESLRTHAMVVDLFLNGAGRPHPPSETP